ncbi:MAG: type IV secretory system conjugative DNA transfer family protein, partial [Chitinophagaceae bacterium]|nr:type IV secretory system conjugative DNA transfer family protein [Chitinophagaceae bacterium]
MFNAVRTYLMQHNRRKENAGRFLTDSEVGALLSSKHNGLVMDGARGKLSPDDSFRNIAIVATTGAGKTSSFILPNLLSLNNCSIVATDPSGALSEKAAADLQRRGYKVVILDPVHLDR